MINKGFKLSFAQADPPTESSRGRLEDLFRSQKVCFLDREVEGLEGIPPGLSFEHFHNAQLAEGLSQSLFSTLLGPEEEDKFIQIVEYLVILHRLRKIMSALPSTIQASQKLIKAQLEALVANAFRLAREYGDQAVLVVQYSD